MTHSGSHTRQSGNWRRSSHDAPPINRPDFVAGPARSATVSSSTSC